MVVILYHFIFTIIVGVFGLAGPVMAQDISMHFSGAVKLGNNAGTCDESNDGGIRYNNSTKTLEIWIRGNGRI